MLVAFYKEQEEKIYLSTVYYEWIENKLNYGDIKQETYDRYNDNFERFFVNYKYPITQKQFKYITEDDIEDYIKSVIRDLELTHKAYEGFRTLIRGIFRLAKKKKPFLFNQNSCLTTYLITSSNSQKLKIAESLELSRFSTTS